MMVRHGQEVVNGIHSDSSVDTIFHYQESMVAVCDIDSIHSVDRKDEVMEET